MSQYVDPEEPIRQSDEVRREADSRSALERARSLVQESGYLEAAHIWALIAIAEETKRLADHMEGR